jgi:predicted ATPase
LGQAPDVVLLLTSRQRLRLQAEDLFLLEGLPYPETADDPDAAQYDAVQLFRDRARRLRKSFTLDGANRAAVVEICRLTAGTPLAIELAAAGVAEHDPPAIAAAIRQTLDFLQADWRDVDPGHRSLRAVFSHSWDLLTPPEQGLLARLSVFRGGFTAAAARAVAGADAAGLAGLAHKSLLQEEDERYTIHMLVREFAAERLAETAAAEAAAAAHAAYYLDLLQKRVGEAPADRALALADLETDLDNVRGGWRWATATADLALLEGALHPLRRFYLWRNRFQEGADAFAAAEARLAESDASSAATRRARVALLAGEGEFLNRMSRHEAAIDRADRALALAGETAALAARAWLLRGDALHATGRFDAAEADLARALQAGEAAGDTAVIAEVALHNGRVARERGRYEAAHTHLRRAHRLFRDLGRPADEMTALGNLAVLAFDRGDYETAIGHYEAGLAIARAIDSRYDQGRLLIGLGAAYDAQGPSAQARAYYLEAQRIARALHDPYGEMLALSNLGVTLSRLGAYEEALACYREALAGRREINDRRGQAWTLLNLGLLHKHQEGYGDALACHQEALEAYEKAIQLHQELGQTHWVMEARAGLARALTAMGETAVALEHVELILDYLDGNPLSGAREYFLVHWSCYQALRAANDARATPFLREAHRLLHRRAEAIEEPALRRAYLENVPFHRQIIAACPASP